MKYNVFANAGKNRQYTANKLIRPLASYKGSKHRKVIQLNQR
ncbi:hypothetical protein N9E23_04910 [Candidatus Pelagibacter sp.]|nr:hypothetical protein [Candidatus Pelagibacter sp.]